MSATAKNLIRTPELAVPRIRDLFFRQNPTTGLAEFIPSRYKISYGGRGGGKSEGYAAILVALGVQYKIRVLCVRELQNSIKESVYKLIEGQIKRLGFERFYELQTAGIYGHNGTEFIFAGIKNNIASIKSMPDINICWAEEAQKISLNSWTDLIPTIRDKEDRVIGIHDWRPRPEIWVSFNPVSENDDTYKRFVVERPPQCRRVMVNWNHNPWFPPELEMERRYLRARADNAPDAHGKHALNALYEHIWEGKTLRTPGGAFFSELSLLVDGKPVEPPKTCHMVFATIDTAVKSGREHDGLGVVYWSYTRPNGLAPGVSPVHILDYDLKKMDGALLVEWLPTVFQQLEKFAVQCKAIMGSAGALIEDRQSGSILLQQAKRRGWKAKALPEALTSIGKSERAISVAHYVHAGDCKMTKVAYERVVTYNQVARNHLLGQVLDFTATVDDQGEDDLLDCFTYGIAVTLGNAKGW